MHARVHHIKNLRAKVNLLFVHWIWIHTSNWHETDFNWIHSGFIWILKIKCTLVVKTCGFNLRTSMDSLLVWLETNGTHDKRDCTCTILKIIASNPNQRKDWAAQNIALFGQSELLRKFILNAFKKHFETEYFIWESVCDFNQWLIFEWSLL